MLASVSKSLRTSWGITTLVLFPVLLTVIMMALIPPSGDDGWVHLNWIEQFTGLIKEGYWYPRWLPYSFGGFGSAAFYFYPPLPYWMIYLISVITPFASATSLLYGISFIASALSIFPAYWYFRKIHLTAPSAILGSVLYGFGTYRVIDMFVRNAVGEQFAFIFLPLVFLSIEFATDGNRNRLRSFFIGLTGWIGLLLTNLPCVVMAGLATIVYCYARGILSHSRHAMLIILTMIAAVCCSAFYLLPMIQLQNLVHLDKLWIYNSTAVDYWQIRNEYYDLRGTKIFLIVVGILSVFAMHLAIKRKTIISGSKHLKAVFWVLILSVVMQLPFFGLVVHSEIFPFTILQFYWRWQVVLLWALSCCFAFLISGTGTTWTKAYLPLIFSIRSLILAVMIFMVHTPMIVQWWRLDVDEYIPATVPYFRTEMEKEFLKQKGPPPIVEPSDSITVRKIDSYSFEIKTAFAAEHRQPFNLFYWPQWKLRNTMGEEIPAEANNRGFFTTTIPAGNQILILKLEKSTAENNGAIVSLGGLLFVGMITYLYRPKRSSLTKSQ